MFEDVQRFSLIFVDFRASNERQGRSILVDFDRLWSIVIDVDRFSSIVIDFGRFSLIFRGFWWILRSKVAGESVASTSPAECAGAVEAK